ncbi:MAG: hypothetical protein RLW87_07965 [Alphaproteobacteria bacterium]
MDIVHSGFDKLEVSFSGAVPLSVRLRLHEAKERAAASGMPEFIDLNGVPVWVKDKGASGGYEFVFDTGPEGEMWAFKNDDDPEKWNFRCVVSAVRCAVDGWEGVRDRLRGQLKAWRVRRPAGQREASLARIDYAVDFMSDGFVPDPMRVVCHWKSDPCEREFTTTIDDVRWRRGVPTSVTIGKLPGRQVQIYDKTKEVAASQKVERQRELWGFCPVKGQRVWRVEVRAGKDLLTRAKIRTFEDAEERLGTLLGECLEKVRLVTDVDVSNISRAKTVPEWVEVRRIVSEAIPNADGAVDMSRVVEGRRADLGDVYRKQIIGCAVAYAHTTGRDAADFLKVMPGEIEADIKAAFATDRSALLDKFRRASARLKFTDDPPVTEPNGGSFNGDGAASWAGALHRMRPGYSATCTA